MNSVGNHSDDNPLAFALHSLHFLSAIQIIFASYRTNFSDETTPLCFDPLQSVSRTQLECWNPSARLLGCLCSVSFDHLGCAFPLQFSIENFLW